MCFAEPDLKWMNVNPEALGNAMAPEPMAGAPAGPCQHERLRKIYRDGVSGFGTECYKCEACGQEMRAKALVIFTPDPEPVSAEPKALSPMTAEEAERIKL